MDAAFWWYEEQQPGLGDDFLQEVELGIAAIRASPERWAIFNGSTRKFLIHRFPYGIVYFLADNVIHIISITHLHRKPGHWRRRRS
jgi:hypothetical protein